VIDATRILERCDALARHSEQAGGLTRVFLSREQREVNGIVVGWMREAGMDARLDAIGNCVGRYEATEPARPCLMLGSHLDTVRDAGKYDGMLGVVAAIECVEELHRTGTRLPHAVEVVGFADEEGVRFGATLLGSRAVAGTFDTAVLDAVDGDGTSMRDALTAFGLDPARIGDAARRSDDVLAYAELHIEQGPVLEALDLPVGVVTAINGGNRVSLEITGRAGHAGTVPMSLRRDALAAAAECVLAIERIAHGASDVVATVGRLDVAPGAVNVIPGQVRFSLDVRAPTDDARRAARRAMESECRAIADRRGVTVAMTPLWEARTSPCDANLQQQFAAAIDGERLRVHRLPSGAGHDGMSLIDIAPIGMLFVRCEEGVSHHPAEAVAVADVDAGTRVLLRFLREFKPPR
jgi:amidase, hydantoinase/carbamoylase family